MNRTSAALKWRWAHTLKKFLVSGFCFLFFGLRTKDPHPALSHRHERGS
jgi:hypothetical protein